MLKIDLYRFQELARRLGLTLASALDLGGEGSRSYRPRRAPRRPTGQELRNPADPFQAGRIADAGAKRDSRAARRQALYDRSIQNNPCLG